MPQPNEEEKNKHNALIVRQINIRNFRGVEKGSVSFQGHTLFVGGNNTGKSTICEALELVLGPERAHRRLIVNGRDGGAPVHILCLVGYSHLHASGFSYMRSSTSARRR